MVSLELLVPSLPLHPKGKFQRSLFSQRRRGEACVICQRWWGPRGHGTALPDGGSLGWKPEDGRRASKAQPRSTTSGFLPGVFTGEQECELCIGDTGKWSPRQMQANHRDLPTETRGDGKLESGRIWDLCSSSNPKKKEGEAFPICYKTQGNMSRTLEERWPRRKHTRWGWHCGLGTTVLDVLVFSQQVCVRLFSDSMGCSPSGSSVAFSREEYRRTWTFPSPGHLPDPGIEPTSPALQADSLPLSHLRHPVLE